MKTTPTDSVIEVVRGDVHVSAPDGVLVEVLTARDASCRAYEMAEPGATIETLRVCLLLIAAAKTARAQLETVESGFRAHDELSKRNSCYILTAVADDCELNGEIYAPESVSAE